MVTSTCSAVRGRHRRIFGGCLDVLRGVDHGCSSHWGIRWSVCVAQSSDSSSCTLVSVVVSGWSQASVLAVLAVLLTVDEEMHGFMYLTAEQRSAIDDELLGDAA